MTRNRRSARQAGARFERVVADWLAANVDDRIDRKVRTGSKDTGDIGGVRVHGQRAVLELKDCAAMSLPAWLREAEVERLNDGALVGVVVHKRRGVADPAEQYVTMTVRDFAALMVGRRCGDE